MIKGIFILQISSEIEWKLFADYIPTVEKRPTEESLSRIAKAFIARPSLVNLNYRQFPYKTYTIPLNSAEDAPRILLTFILDASENIELVQFFNDQIKSDIMQVITDEPELLNTLNSIMDARNALLEKLEKSKLIQEEIEGLATKLIDGGDLKQAEK